MKIVYRVTKDDYMAAYQLFVSNEKPWYRQVSRKLMPWMGGLILLEAGYMVTLRNRNPALIGVLALMGVYFLYCSFTLRRYFRRRFEKDQRFQHDFTATISAEEIYVVTPTAESHFQWNGFVRFLESDRIFMLFHAEWLFSIFPKRALSEGEIDEFRSLIQRNHIRSQ
jgi:YcxB-like protein